MQGIGEKMSQLNMEYFLIGQDWPPKKETPVSAIRVCKRLLVWSVQGCIQKQMWLQDLF